MTDGQALAGSALKPGMPEKSNKVGVSSLDTLGEGVKYERVKRQGKKRLQRIVMGKKPLKA